MNRLRIVEILEAYRPGEGLESDPEIRQALELAAQDPELIVIRQQIHDFDKAFGYALRQVEAPVKTLRWHNGPPKRTHSWDDINPIPHINEPV